MIVLPNSFERYISALRIFVSLSILKHGLQPRHIKNLKKIHKAEAFYYKTLRQSIDINSLCINMLNAIDAYKQNFEWKCHCDGNFFINKNIFTFLILEITTKSNFIKIISSNHYLQLYFYGNTSHLSPFIKALNGFSFFEIKNRLAVIIIPITKTEAPAVKTESEWDWLFNKFSAVNLYFGNA